MESLLVRGQLALKEPASIDGVLLGISSTGKKGEVTKLSKPGEDYFGIKGRHGDFVIVFPLDESRGFGMLQDASKVRAIISSSNWKTPFVREFGPADNSNARFLPYVMPLAGEVNGNYLFENSDLWPVLSQSGTRISGYSFQDSKRGEERADIDCLADKISEAYNIWVPKKFPL